MDVIIYSCWDLKLTNVSKRDFRTYYVCITVTDVDSTYLQL